MKLRDFKLERSNHFVAMEYYGLILNRTFLVLIYKNNLIGLKVNGLVSAPTVGDPFTDAVTGMMAIKGNLKNPYAYIKRKYLRKLEDLEIEGNEILQISSANFKLMKSDIIEVSQTNKKKWGMGPYPHDGRIFIKTRQYGRREFIILGNQSSKDISEWLLDN